MTTTMTLPGNVKKVAKGNAYYLLKDGKMVGSYNLPYKWEVKDHKESMRQSIKELSDNQPIRWVDIDGSLDESTYDGSGYEAISDYSKPFIKVPKEIDMMPLDSKTRAFKPINLLKFVQYLYMHDSIRQIVYNNSWGIKVMNPKRNNYPENVVLDTIKDILLEGLHSQPHYYRELVVLYLESAEDCAPDSLAAKVWRLLPNARYSELDIKPYEETAPEEFSGVWETYMSRLINE